MYARMHLQLNGEGFRRAKVKVSVLTHMLTAPASLEAAFSIASPLPCFGFHSSRSGARGHHNNSIVKPLRAARAPSGQLSRQRGMSLLEVMIAVLVLAVGILGAASLQLSAIRYSASAGYSTQANLIASDLLDRMRASSASLASYATSIDGECTGSQGDADIGADIAADLAAEAVEAREIVARDLADFAEAVTCQLPRSTGTIVISGDRATVNVSWSEARAAAGEGDTRFVISSVVR